MSKYFAHAAGVMIAGAVVLGSSPIASAQALPPVSTERLSSSQQADVRAYVQSRLDTLDSDLVSTAEGARARRQLIEPMNSRDTSVAMRQAFAEAAADRLPMMVASENEQRAVSALLIAGNIGHRSGVQLLEAGLDDPREAVQIGAAAGAKAFVRVLEGRLGGAQADLQREVQTLLGDTLAVTSSGHVAQSIIGALTALPENPSFVAASGTIIADSMAGQVTRRRGLEATDAIADGWAGAMERAIAAQLIFQRAAAISGADVSRNTQLQSARLAGIALSLVRDSIDGLGDAGIEAADVEAFVSAQARLIRGAETLLILSESNLSGRDRQQRMGRLIDTKDTDGLIDAMNTWVGATGILTAAPFSIPASALGN